MENKEEIFEKGQQINAKFIGFDIIQNKLDINEDLCQQLVTKLKKDTLTKKEHKQKIELKINLDLIEINDKSTKKVMFKHEINRILFISIDKTDSRSIGYVYKNDDENFIYFAFKTEKQSQELFIFLKELFEFKKEKSINKNTPTSHSRASSISSKSLTNSQESNYLNEPQEDLSGLFFNNEEISCVRRLGSGSFGNVYLTSDNKCLKLIPAIKVITSESELFEVYASMQDINLLISKEISSNLISYFGLFENDSSSRIGILTEYIEGGTLRQIIDYLLYNNQQMPEEKCIKWLYQMIRGLDFLHSLKIIHRDVRPRNIYIQNDTAKLGDLGMARTHDSFQKCYLRSVRSMPNYKSPEFLLSSNYSYSTDIWSLGCVLFEMIKLRKAYDASSYQDIFVLIVQSEPPRLDSLVFKPILNSMLQKNQEKRLSAQSLLNKLTKLQVYLEDFKDFV